MRRACKHNFLFYWCNRCSTGRSCQKADQRLQRLPLTRALKVFSSVQTCGLVDVTQPLPWFSRVGQLIFFSPFLEHSRRKMSAFNPFLHYFTTGSDTASCQDYEEYEFVEFLSEENQIINLFTPCKLQPHKLSQYTLATRLSSCWFWILFDNMNNAKQIRRLQNPFSKTAFILRKLFSLVSVMSFVSLNLCSLAIRPRFPCFHTIKKINNFKTFALTIESVSAISLSSMRPRFNNVILIRK